MKRLLFYVAAIGLLVLMAGCWVRGPERRGLHHDRGNHGQHQDNRHNRDNRGRHQDNNNDHR